MANIFELLDPNFITKKVDEIFNGKTLEQLQSIDPMAEWEKITGKHYSQNNEIENLVMLSFVAAINKRKSTQLKASKDTHFGIKFDEFIDLMIENGFQIGYQGEYKSSSTSTQFEREVILYDKENGFIVYTNSFAGDGLNSAKLYGEIEPAGYEYTEGDEKKYPLVKEMYDRYQRSQQSPYAEDIDLKSYIEKNIHYHCVPKHSSGSGVNNSRNYAFDFDMRDFAISRLNKLKADSMFARPAKKWVQKNKFMYFMNYEEEKAGKDYEEVTNQKLMQCPQEVRDIINDPERFKSIDDTENN